MEVRQFVFTRLSIVHAVRSALRPSLLDMGRNGVSDGELNFHFIKHPSRLLIVVSMSCATHESQSLYAIASGNDVGPKSQGSPSAGTVAACAFPFAFTFATLLTFINTLHIMGMLFWKTTVSAQGCFFPAETGSSRDSRCISCSWRRAESI